MRIVVHGQQAFGKAVLEALLKRGEDVVAVYVAPEKPGQKADPMKEAALAAKLPLYQPASYRKPEVWDEFRALKPDLQVMAFVTLFVPEDFLNIPTHGSIQYHPSLLPKFRGPSSINWPIIKGETETGLSIFWPDNGLDTGDILLQKKTPISPDDLLGSVYFDRLFPMGVEAMLEAVDLVKAGKAPRIKQETVRRAMRAGVRLRMPTSIGAKPWSQIHNLIRGCNPAPGAWTTCNGAKLQVFESKTLSCPRCQRASVGRWVKLLLLTATVFSWLVRMAASSSYASNLPMDRKRRPASLATAAKLSVGMRLG